MDKTAAVRSQARRAALTKVAFDPAQALGYAGMLGGGALAGDAVLDGEQSYMKRIGKGAVGAGLAYFGHKALTDPQWQNGIRRGAHRAGDAVVRLLAQIRGGTKAAEAAYTEGFCKAAEIAGVDPVVLYKQAAGVPFLGRMFNAGKRYLSLLGGGNVVRQTADLNALQRNIARTQALKLGIPDMPAKLPSRLTGGSWLSRLKDKITGVERRYRRWLDSVDRNGVLAERKAAVLRSMREREAALSAARARESEAVAKARLLTGGGVLGAGGVAYGVSSPSGDGGAVDPYADYN